MTKQEEIREGIKKTLTQEYNGYNWETVEEFRSRVSRIQTDLIISYLKSKRVAIKVEGELPVAIIEQDIIDLELQKTSRGWVMSNLAYQIKEAGYTAWKELV